jgi:hypothetical protein
LPAWVPHGCHVPNCRIVASVRRRARPGGVRGQVLARRRWTGFARSYAVTAFVLVQGRERSLVGRPGLNPIDGSDLWFKAQPKEEPMNHCRRRAAAVVAPHRIFCSQSGAGGAGGSGLGGAPDALHHAPTDQPRADGVGRCGEGAVPAQAGARGLGVRRTRGRSVLSWDVLSRPSVSAVLQTLREMRAHPGPRISGSTPCSAGAERKEIPIPHSVSGGQPTDQRVVARAVGSAIHTSLRTHQNARIVEHRPPASALAHTASMGASSRKTTA